MVCVCVDIRTGLCWKQRTALLLLLNQFIFGSVNIQAAYRPEQIPIYQHRRYYALTVTTNVELGGCVDMGFGLSSGAASRENGRRLVGHAGGVRMSAGL